VKARSSGAVVTAHTSHDSRRHLSAHCGTSADSCPRGSVSGTLRRHFHKVNEPRQKDCYAGPRLASNAPWGSLTPNLSLASTPSLRIWPKVRTLPLLSRWRALPPGLCASTSGLTMPRPFEPAVTRLTCGCDAAPGRLGDVSVSAASICLGNFFRPVAEPFNP
jgi:hypothetical protein